ncbi:Hypothetical predicted protein [Olea europaea subsp. europaea]|uniref:Uncharacterized protein n=1 Tax=Olea europaea subsp. europaea TaxID=158383 RepID=A0A8S0S895_OLEEU|nr:Hypothetical predicted protein [Olea europaea subsp. europaea]
MSECNTVTALIVPLLQIRSLSSMTHLSSAWAGRRSGRRQLTVDWKSGTVSLEVASWRLRVGVATGEKQAMAKGRPVERDAIQVATCKGLVMVVN